MTFININAFSWRQFYHLQVFKHAYQIDKHLYHMSGYIEVLFSSLPFRQAVAKMYQPGGHFYQPENLRWFAVLLLINFRKKKFQKNFYLPVGQVKDKFHQPDHKIHQPWAIGPELLCTLRVYGIYYVISSKTCHQLYYKQT